MSYLIQPLFGILLLSGIFGIIWLRSGIISLEYSIGELENRKLENMKETKFLLAERAMAMSMQRVEKMASRDLGLVLADRTKVVYVRDGNSGPSRASLDKKYGGAYEKADIPGRRELQPAGIVRGGGYQ